MSKIATRAEGSTISPRRVTVTAIVPVRNEGRFIEETIQQILKQELPNIDLEILVVDGMSSDSTPAIVAELVNRDSRVRLLPNPQRLSSAARNIGIENSRGDYVVIIDGHCEIPSRHYFVDLVRGFEESGADCLGRPQPLDVSHATSWQKAIALARSSRLGHHPESFIYSDVAQFVPARSVAVAYRRDVFDKVGLFDPIFDAHEDGEFNYRCDQAGLRCYFLPALAVKYYPRSTLVGLSRQMVRYGRGRVRFWRKHPRTLDLGAVIPAAFVAFIALGGASAIVVPSTAYYYAAGVLVYLCAIVGEGIKVTLGTRDLNMIWRIPVALAAVHVGAGVGTLIELIHPLGRVSDSLRGGAPSPA